MKRILIVLVVFFLVGIFSINAQNYEGTGKKLRSSYHPPNCCHNIDWNYRISSNSTVRQDNDNQIDSSVQVNQVSSSRQEKQKSSSKKGALELGVTTPIQQSMNQFPAIPIPLVNKSLKFDLGGDTWIASLNGENFMGGSCAIEETSNGYKIKLKTSHVWTGAIEEVVDLLNNAGIPLGSAATPLKTAAKLASKVAKWVPFKLSTINLDYSGNRLSFVSISK